MHPMTGVLFGVGLVLVIATSGHTIVHARSNFRHVPALPNVAGITRSRPSLPSGILVGPCNGKSLVHGRGWVVDS